MENILGRAGNDDHDEYMYSALHWLDGAGKSSETEGWYSCLESHDSTVRSPPLPPSDQMFSIIPE